MNSKKNPRRLSFETLEDRRVLATFSSVGSVLNLNLNQTQEKVNIKANTDSYSFTLTQGTWSGSNDANLDGDGTDTLTVTADGKSTFDAINITDSNSGASVGFADSGDHSYSDSISIQLDSTVANGISFSGETRFTSDASLTASTTREVTFQANARVSAIDGDISISANHANSHENSKFIGMVFDDAELEVIGSGNIELLAQGGNSSLDSNYGIAIWGDSLVKTDSGTINIQAMGGGNTNSFGNHGVLIVGNTKIQTGDSGQININGTGGSVQNYDNIGVIVCGSSEIESSGGSVTISGTGGGQGANSYWNMGVKVCQSAEVNLTGAASLLIEGYGGGSAGKENYGALIRNDAAINSENGAITIQGTGGSSSGYSQQGVLIEDKAVVQTTGSGNIEINGYGGGLGNSEEHRGIHIDGDSTVRTTQTGNVILNGIGGNTSGRYNVGVEIDSSGSIVTNHGSIEIHGLGGGHGAASESIGIRMDDSTSISSTGDGSIAINGTSGSTTGFNSIGIELEDSASITANGGHIDLSGTSSGMGAATTSVGIQLEFGTKLSTTQSGRIALTGIGGNAYGNGNDGVQLWGDTTIDVVDGEISINGFGGGVGAADFGNGIYLSRGALARATGTGGIELNGVGGNSTGRDNRGVHFGWGGSTLSTVDGDIKIIGSGGGTGGSEFNEGVLIESSGALRTSGTGSISIKGNGGATVGESNYGVHLSHATIETASGLIALDGNGGGLVDETSYHDWGVRIHSSEIQSGLDGDISIRGYGGPGGHKQHGIALSGTSKVETADGDVQISGFGGGSNIIADGIVNYGLHISQEAKVTSTGSGNVELYGEAGASDSSAHHGVVLQNSSLVTTSDGNVVIQGKGGGTKSSSHNFGIHVFDDVTINSTGDGDVVLTGTGGLGNNSNEGISLANTTGVSTNKGDITLTGTGGGSLIGEGSSNRGVTLSAPLSPGELANINITGIGGNTEGMHNHGVQLGSDLNLNGGKLSVYGLGGQSKAWENHVGIVIQPNKTISSKQLGGDIDLAFSSMWVYDTATIETNQSNSISLESISGNGRDSAIVLRDAGQSHPWPHSPSTALWEPVLDRFFTPNLIIGGEHTSNIYIDGELTRSALTNITLNAANSIEITDYGSVDPAGGSLNIVSDGAVSFKPHQPTLDIDSGNISLSESVVLDIAINGNTENKLYEQLHINGEVAVSGDLLLSGLYEPQLNESFTIIKNDGTDAVAGEFTDLPEGSVIRFNGVPLKISYEGGTGNDVTLTAVLLAPTMDSISDIIINENDSEQSVALTGILSGSTDSAPIRIFAESENPNLISSVETIYTSPNSTGTLKFTPESDMAGSSVITVTIEDGGIDEDLSTASDNASTVSTFQVRVLEAHPWHNYQLKEDVDGDGNISPADALTIINEINLNGSGTLSEERTEIKPPYLDVNKDGSLSPLDALIVINHLNITDYMMSIDVSFTNASGQDVSEIEIGGLFYVTLSSTDWREAGDGVFAAYADVHYDTSMVSTAGSAQFIAPYENGKSLDTTVAGVLNEWGAFGGIDPPDTSRVIISRIPMRADRVGTALFGVDGADESPHHDALLYGSTNTVSHDSIRFGAETLEIIEAAEGEYAASVDEVFRDFE